MDGHLDLAWNALQWNRDLALPAEGIRRMPQAVIKVVGDRTPPEGMEATVSLPDMRRGGVGLCFGTLLARATGRPVPHLDWLGAEQAAGIALGQLGYYRAIESRRWVRIIGTLDELDDHVAEWTAHFVTRLALPVGIVPAMEGADPILEPECLPSWHKAGLRALGLSHYGPGRYAGGTGCEDGLTRLGPRLLTQMAELKTILDVTHLSDRAFAEALGLWSGPVMASHNNCRALVPHQRQFSDEQLKELIGRDGVIGAVFDAWMLAPDWEHGKAGNPTVTMEAVADHIDHVCQLAGDARHAAIGSDLDGGFGKEESPTDLDTIADMRNLAGILAKRGYKEDDVAGIMHGNWLRLLRKAWGPA